MSKRPVLAIFLALFLMFSLNLAQLNCLQAKEVVSPSSTEEEKPKVKRVYADIVGDLLHSGHIEFFKKAKAFGDYLIIGVLPDEVVASYKRTPIMKLEERKALLEECKLVDEVIVAPGLRLTEEWIKEHQIDFVVHGDDFTEETLLDQYAVPLKMGIMRIVPYTRGISTTEIIHRIKDREEKKEITASTEEIIK